MAGPGVISFTRTEKYSSHLSEEIQQMREDRDFTDFEISVKTERFPCHRLMLASHSPYMKKFLKSDMAEAAKRSISLDHFTLETVTVILDYMYCGQVSFTTAQLMDMIKACEFLKMEVLLEMCIEEVAGVLEPANVIPWMELAEKVKLAPIKAHCMKIMVSSFAEISHGNAFLTMKYRDVQGYFAEVVKSAKDFDEVLHASMRWVNHEPENRSAHVEDLLHQVQPDNCSLDTILDVMQTHTGIIMKSNEHVLKLLTDAMRKIKTKNEAKAIQTLEMKTETQEPPTQTEAQGRINEPATQTKEAHSTKQVSTTSTQTATEESVMETPKQEKKVATNKKLVIVGGIVEQQMSPMCWILSKDKQFREFCTIPHGPGLGHSVCQSPEGFVVTGGQDSDVCLMYDAARKSWCKLQRMLARRIEHGSICTKGVLAVIGGLDSRGENSSSVDCMVMKHGQWQHFPDISIRVANPGVAGINGMVYVLDKRITHQLLQLDIETREWFQRASFPPQGKLSWDASMIELNGKLCVAGGDNRCCALYDPSVDTWTIISQPSERHYFGSLVYFGDKLLLLGGKYSGTNVVEERNVPDGRWEVSTITMPANLYYHHAVVLDIPQCE